MIARILVLSAVLALAAVGSVQAASSDFNQALANDQSNDQSSYQSQDNLYYAADASEADSDAEFEVNQFGWGGGFGRGGWGGGFGRGGWGGGYGRGGWGGGYGRGGWGGGFGRGGFGW